jgi:serine/threonine protein kinase
MGDVIEVEELSDTSTPEDMPRNPFDDELDYLTRHQRREDIKNRLFKPMLDEDFYESTPIGEYILGDRIHWGYQSLVFEVINDPSILLKYEVNQIQEDALHPLVRDRWYGSIAHALGVGPEMLYISPPVPLPEASDLLKTEFTMPITDKQTAIISGRTVRCLVMRRAAGMTLNAYRKKFRKGKLNFSTAIELGELLISAIARLHREGGIVHGDIHSGNIMIDVDPTTGNIRGLKLIDFGEAFKPIDPISNQIGKIPHVHFLFSPWQNMGLPASMRDDVFRAIQAIALSMHNWSYLSWEDRISNRSLLVRWKLAGDLFGGIPVKNARDVKSKVNSPKKIVLAPNSAKKQSSPDTVVIDLSSTLHRPISRHPVESLRIPEEVKGEIKRILKESILDEIRSPEIINDANFPIDYNRIINGFRTIKNLLAGSANYVERPSAELVSRGSRSWSV